MLDLIIKNATLVRDPHLEVGDVALEGGQIVQIAPEILESAKETWDATGQHLFAGMIDVHVHFNEPGRADWEGISSGSSALAAGGGTVFFDMPLNSSPTTLTAASFAEKKALMEQKSVVDFGLWGGLTPDNLEHLPDLAHAGAVGFKAFMSNSGLEEFKAVDDLTLLEGMRIAAQLEVPVALHAESESLTAALTRRAIAQGKHSAQDYLESRPVLAELEAISKALLFAAETGCSLHVVHVSTARGVALISEAQTKGVKVSLETCPHYLVLCEEDLERLGAVAKCAPPLRSSLDHAQLWAALEHLDLIASDHSPAPPSMKTGDDFFAMWGGISGVQSTLELMLTEGHHAREIPLLLISRLLSYRPARRFGLMQKGFLEIGMDADLTLVDLNAPYTLEASDLLYRHRQSPYLGHQMQAKVQATLSRGRVVYQNGKILLEGGGKMVHSLREKG